MGCGKVFLAGSCASFGGDTLAPLETSAQVTGRPDDVEVAADVPLGPPAAPAASHTDLFLTWLRETPRTAWAPADACATSRAEHVTTHTNINAFFADIKENQCSRVEPIQREPAAFSAGSAAPMVSTRENMKAFFQKVAEQAKSKETQHWLTAKKKMFW